MKVLLAKIALPFTRLWQAHLLKRLEKITAEKWDIENEIACRGIRK